MATEKKDVEIVKFEKQVSPLILRAESLTINNADEMKVATATLSEVNKTLDKVKVERDKILKPLKEAADAEKARWEPIEKTFKPLVERLRSLMGAYQTEQVKKQKAEEKKIAERTKEGKGNFSTETAIKKFGEIEKAEEKVATDEGSVSFRTDRILKITDKSKIPLQYYVLDEKAILEALKSGEKVTGAELEEIQVPVNRRK